MPLFSPHRSPRSGAGTPASHGPTAVPGAKAGYPASDHAGNGFTPGGAPLSQRHGLGGVHVAPPPPAGSAASALLKRYRPLQTRAAGGFGSVEICLDGRLQRRVAIKRMPLASPYNRVSTETTATALAEARTASMLQHPNIVQVIDFTYDSAYAYLVMEYVDGMSLEEFLAQVDGHSLTYDEAACIADALVQALSFAHENGVLHLDIKPANVLIDHSGHVKLADFGMATLASAAGFGGARGGTIGYMPPEQLNGEVVDERSDIFALASVLYESLCAATPFRAGTPADSLANIEKGVIYPSNLLPDIPESAEDALLCALAPNACDRMADVGEFGDLFLANLGNPREGRRSLARIIARLTSDEEEEQGGETQEAARAWELDPAEGYLGSRTPRARFYALGAISGAAVAVTSWTLLGDLGIADPLVHALTAMGIGAGAALAPQMGSALTAGGWLMLILNNTPLLSVLPVAILSFALLCAWWLVWGRLQPASSMAFTVAAACTLTCGSTSLAAPVVAALAAFFLAPAHAATSTACGLAFARLLIAAHVAGGAPPLDMAARALFSLEFLIPAAGFSAAAAGAGWMLERICQARQDSRSTSLTTILYLLLPVVSVALRYLAQPMEIASVPPLEVAEAVGLGCLSSIIVWICVYLLGYKRETPEGDRS